jgi:DNA-binding Lrp family transcriptional regulator
MKEVEEVAVIYGIYDLIAKITSDTMENLKELITTKVRHLNGVRSTVTMISAESKKLK